MIVVIGSINQDVLFKLSRMPHKGETFLADDFLMSGGGKGANQAVQCAKLGAETHMVGRIGMDNFGEGLVLKLGEYGVDISHISRSEKAHTGIASMQILPDGSVYLTLSNGANYDWSPDHVEAADALLQAAKIVVLQMEIPIPVVEAAVLRAKKHGCWVLLNAAPAQPIDAGVLKLVDCLVVNELEAGFYAGAEIRCVESGKNHAAKLRSMVGGDVVITLGEQGSLLCEETGCSHFAADTSVRAVDTTGAGDSYVGALAAKMLAGADLKEACLFASRVSAVTVTRLGVQVGMPTLSDLEAPEMDGPV